MTPASPAIAITSQPVPAADRPGETGALIAGSRWTSSGGGPTVITYSFATSSADYSPTTPFSTSASPLSEADRQTTREVLRGGWLIGYLERLAIVAAVVLGRFEIVAAVIAVKGLGRFSELDNAAARERFIIGTLTSIIWAGTCALLIVSANS